MKLRVAEIRTLDNGALSIEVFGDAGIDKPSTSMIDNIRVRVYVIKDEIPAEFNALLEKAIAIASQGLR